MYNVFEYVKHRIYNISQVLLCAMYERALLRIYPTCHIIVRAMEGTGTRPDYLVNHDWKKLRGRSGQKIAHKSRNSCAVNDHDSQFCAILEPNTTYKGSKNVVAVTCIALSCAHMCARLLQPLAQSLRGSPGTLVRCIKGLFFGYVKYWIL